MEKRKDWNVFWQDKKGEIIQVRYLRWKDSPGYTREELEESWRVWIGYTGKVIILTDEELAQKLGI